MFLREFCAEDCEQVQEAIRCGAQRVELCSCLDVGGVTPSAEVIQKAVGYCHDQNVPVMVMIRCREGNFYYSDAEFREMGESISLAKRLKADGVVFGALDAFGNPDKRIAALVSAAGAMSLTFHMAFDEIPIKQRFQAIDTLCAYGFHRILTHGGPMCSPIEHNLSSLEDMVSYARGRISIMPGGGITTSNADFIAKRLGVNELHGTKIVSLSHF